MSMLWREKKMMLEAPNRASGSPSSLSPLPECIAYSLSVASGISGERPLSPLLAMPETRDHFPTRARKTTNRSPLHHPSGTCLPSDERALSIDVIQDKEHTSK